MQVLEDADRYVQDLNDRFTNPSGRPAVQIDPVPEMEEQIAASRAISE